MSASQAGSEADRRVILESQFGSRGRDLHADKSNEVAVAHPRHTASPEPLTSWY